MKKKFKSVRVRLFMTLCIVVTIIVLFLVIINNVVLETFYLYSKTKTLKDCYEAINNMYSQIAIGNNSFNVEEELNKMSIRNDFDILIENEQSFTLYTSDTSFSSAIKKINELINSKTIGENKNVILVENKLQIVRIVDEKNNMNYIILSATLENDYVLYIRIPIASIQESVKISNNLLISIGFVSIAIAGILASYISRKFTEPILELNEIAKSMSKLDFRKKYREKDTDDEINDLGKSINTMSEKLEKTIKQLRNTNRELEKDIEEKSKIDEMRKQFISDVSHELKTPIALIQGYAEGLLENVTTDEASRKFYSEVILDETNKMDRLVKQLLELMKLEYRTREFHNSQFNVTELIKEVIRKCDVMLQEKQIMVEFDETEKIEVNADEFYIEQVITNYFTNAIKHAKEVEGKKIIRIEKEDNKEKGMIRIKIFNTGENISEEEFDRIWKRFYKVDASRNREDGGTGIGLALVKAIMNNYGTDFGVQNKADGVEFYFELNNNC